MDFTEIRYDVDGHVATITLDRPDRLNAYTRTMHEELIQAFDLADADDDVRAMIVTGEGRGFCAGPEHREHLDPDPGDSRARGAAVRHPRLVGDGRRCGRREVPECPSGVRHGYPGGVVARVPTGMAGGSLPRLSATGGLSQKAG